MRFCVIGQDGSFLIVLSELIFLWNLVVIFWADWKRRRIPNYCIIAMWVSVILMFVCNQRKILSVLAGTCVIGVPFSILYFLKSNALGWADVKLTAAIGAYMGYRAVIFAVVIGTFCSACYCMISLLIRLWKREGTESITIPLGSFICFGAFGVWMMK